MFAELLRQRLPELAELQVRQLAAHYELLMRWNRKLNLTALGSVEEIVERHYCESVFLARRLPAGAWSIADLGSGAGFPGIPVAVLRPECGVALIESHQRKAVFLREATRELGNVRVMAKRAEQIGEAFDYVVSRAVRLGPAFRKLGRNAAVLGGEREPGDGFDWQPRLRLPWGERRFLWLGRNVSRETSG